jgi:hypothetical protein
MKNYLSCGEIGSRRWILALLVCAAILVPSSVNAQESKGAIYGYVADKSGELIGGAEIVILEGASRVGEIFTSRGKGSLVFDGGFFICDLTPGTYKLEARKRGYSSAQAQAVKVTPGDATKVALTLVRIEMITGNIQGKVAIGRKALEDVSVSIFVEGEKKALLETKTSADGSFSFENLEPGKYVVVVEWNRKEAYRSKTIEVKAKKTESLPVTLEPAAVQEEPGTVSGKVVDKDEKPVSGATVSVKEAPEGARKLQTRTGENGEFEIRGLKPGKYVLRAAKGQLADEKKVTVSSGRTVRTSLRIK